MDLLGDVCLTQYVEDLIEVDLPLHSPCGDAGLGQELAPLLLDSLGEDLGQLHQEGVGLHMFLESRNSYTLVDFEGIQHRDGSVDLPQVLGVAKQVIF